MRPMLSQDIKKYVSFITTFKLEDEDNMETFDQFNKEYHYHILHDNKYMYCFPNIYSAFGFVQTLLDMGNKEDDIEFYNITKSGKIVGYVVVN